MMQKLLNIIYLIVLVVCVCLIIRVFNAQPTAVPVATSNGTVALEVPRIEVSASETKKFAADKFEMGFSLEIRGKDKETVSKRLAERRSVIFENVKSLEIPQSNVEQNSVEMHKEWSYRNSKRELVFGTGCRNPAHVGPAQGCGRCAVEGYQGGGQKGNRQG